MTGSELMGTREHPCESVFHNNAFCGTAFPTHREKWCEPCRDWWFSQVIRTFKR